MKYWIALGCVIFFGLGACWAFLFHKKFPKEIILWSLLSILLPLLLPYQLIEKSLLDYEGGTAWAFFSAYAVSITELFILLILLILAKNQKPEMFAQNKEVFAVSFFLGLHFGWGKVFRDSLLLSFHHLSVYYGYSQFMAFPSLSYLVSRIMRTIFDAQNGAFLGIALLSPYGWPPRSALLSFIFAFKGIPGFIETTIQFVPRFRLFSSLYLVSFFPLIIIIGFIVIQRLLQRKEEEKR
ncbi:MAG: hypothetical protein ABDK94_10375 [Atribacterota bacterium]